MKTKFFNGFNATGHQIAMYSSLEADSLPAKFFQLSTQHYLIKYIFILDNSTTHLLLSAHRQQEELFNFVMCYIHHKPAARRQHTSELLLTLQEGPPLPIGREQRSTS